MTDLAGVKVLILRSAATRGKYMRFKYRPFVMALALLAFPANAQAQDGPGSVSLELNRVQPIESGGCRVMMIATNDLERPMTNLSLELVAFDKAGMVDQFIRVNFPRISTGKTKVLQFDLVGKACDSLSRLHVNDAQNCVPQSVQDVVCLDVLKLSNRTEIQFAD